MRADSNHTEPPHPALCVITSQPARYRDPKTGLPYYNAYAFKEIQKLAKGNFKWSKLLSTWVGDGSDAAQGVPDRFTRPETEDEERERLERKEQEKKLADEQKKTDEVVEAAKLSALKTEEPAPTSVPDVDVCMGNTASLAVPVSFSTSVPALAAPNMATDVQSKVPSPKEGQPEGPSPAPVATVGNQPGPML